MAFKFNPFTGKLDIAPARGATGATGFGATGATGLTGATGQTGQSSTFYNYQADTNQYSGVPTTGHLIWNNVTQTSATTIILSHIDALGNDIDVFFPLFKTNDTFVIQDKGNSNNFQTWRISATPTVILNSYVSIPVTLVTSGGITQFTNNQQLLFAIVTSGLQGATGITGATGATGIQGATGATGPTITGTGVVKVVSGVYQDPATTIVNADVSATAAIAQSKLSLIDAAADGTTKGISAYTASDFNSAAGVISIDYTNGQSASGSTKGFLTSSDWTTFNNKQATITTGSVDNAILRADGTGGTTLQNSGLVVDDAIVSFTSVTGDNTTDIITATGSAFVAGQPIRFTSLTGGTGLNTSINYYVINPSGATFQVATSPGGAFVNFTTNITAATIFTGFDSQAFTSVTGNQATDIITATGSALTNGTPVIFASITGGSGLSANTVYYVINASGATFQLSTSVGGSFINFTTDITAAVLQTQVGFSIQPNVTLSQNTTETNSSLVLSPKGTGALIAQKPDGSATGGNSRGANAVDWQKVRSTNNQVASGSSSVICGGESNRASNGRSVVCGGRSNLSSGFDAFIGAGLLNVSSGAQSVVCGGGYYTGVANVPNEAQADTSGILCGYGALANRLSMQAHASGSFNNLASGDAQRARFVLRCKTTTNTGVEMALDGGTTYLGIPSGKVIALTINISGVKSDGSAVAHYLRQYCVKNVGGVSSQVYAPVTIGSDNAAGTSINLYANDPDDTLRIQVTGIASETWRWVAAVDAVEIAYGT